MSLSLADCENERRLASREYKKLKRNAKHTRGQFIHELATQQAARGNETIRNVVQRLTRNEEIRASHKRIKTVTKPFQGATERVMIRDENNEENNIATTDKDTVEKTLHHELSIQLSIPKRTTNFTSWLGCHDNRSKTDSIRHFHRCNKFISKHKTIY